MLSDLQLVYMGPRNSTELLKINTTRFQVEREPVYTKIDITYAPYGAHFNCTDTTSWKCCFKIGPKLWPFWIQELCVYITDPI